MSDILRSILDALRMTAPFHDLPATNRPHDVLWTAYNRTLLALRLPLYHQRLRKPQPKPKVYDEAIQMGLAILSAFAHHAGTHQATVQIIDGKAEAISFKPRPWEANWTATYAISPTSLHHPETDPMTEDGLLPQVSTTNILHLSRLVALAFLAKEGIETMNGTATFEFFEDWDKPSGRLMWRPYGQPNTPSMFEALRARA